MAKQTPMEMSDETESHFINILDTFSGADGGISFVQMRRLIEDMDKKAAKGDKPAQEVILIMKRFSRMIDTAKKFY